MNTRNIDTIKSDISEAKEMLKALRAEAKREREQKRLAKATARIERAKARVAKYDRIIAGMSSVNVAENDQLTLAL